MAISHLCLECGHDLARRRARREPHYGLPLVVCPACGAASVRRRHPLAQGFRTLLRLDAALTAMFLQICAIAIFGVSMAASTVGINDLLVQDWFDETAMRENIAILLALGLLVPMANGAWLAAAFSHWRRRALVWGVWTALTTASIALFCGIWTMQETWGQASSASWGSEFMIRFLPHIGVLMILLIVSTTGIPLGSAAQWLWERYRQWRWRLRRRRRRRMLAA